MCTWCSCVNVHSYTLVVFFFKQKTAYEMRISDWSSDVCSSDLSAATAKAWPPAALISRTTVAAASSLAPKCTATCAPSAARRKAICLPIPRDAPVTRAALPSKRAVMCLSFLNGGLERLQEGLSANKASSNRVASSKRSAAASPSGQRRDRVVRSIWIKGASDGRRDGHRRPLLQ